MKKAVHKFFFWAIRYNWLLLGLVFLISCGAVWRVSVADYSANMFHLLPQDSLSIRNLKAVVDSGLANKITFYFCRKDGKALDDPADMAAVTEFAGRLKKIEGVRLVVTSPTASSPQKMYSDFIESMPQFYSPSQLPQGIEIEKKLKADLKNLYLNPLGGAAQIKYDPWGWTMPYFLKLENILRISGVQFYAGNNSFILSPDRKVGMLLIYTDISASEFEKSMTLLTALKKAASCLPSAFCGEFFSPHVHMLENARIMKTDLRIFAVCTLVLFLLLFSFVYKNDWRGIVIPGIVSLGSFWAAAAMGLVFDVVLVFTLAMGGVLIGIAGDYGIHLYAASLSERRVQHGIELFPKLCLAFFTTCLMFLCFIFTGVPAFIQFGAFSALTLFFAFVLLLFLLPRFLFFRKRPRTVLNFFQLLGLEKVSMKHAVAAGGLLGLLLIGFCFVKFNTDIKKFDVAYETLAHREKQYQKAFAKTLPPYVLFYSADSFDRLLTKCQEDKRHLQKKIPAIEMITPGDLFLSHAEKRKNLGQWQAFLRSGKWTEYKKEFCAKACELGMTEAFFSEFFKRFEHGIQYERRTQPEMLSFAFSNMIGKSKHWTGVAMVDQKSAASDALVKNSSAAVFTEEIFTRQLFYDILGKLPVILPVIILILFLSVFFSLRSWLKTCLVCLPIASCIAGIAGIHGLLGEEITLAVVVAGIITIGISVDYGVLLVTSNLSPHVFNAITFSTVTTAVGGLTVFLTHHPMLRTAGLTIVAGILSSCFFTFYLLYPILKKLKSVKAGYMGVLLIAGSVLFGSSGCTALPREQILMPLPVADESKCQMPETLPKEFQGSLLMDYKTGQVSFLIAGKITRDGQGHFVGFSPGGLKIFALFGKGFGVEKYEWQKSVISESRQKKLSAFLYKAIAAHLYSPGRTGKDLILRTGNRGVVLERKLTEDKKISCFYSGEDCRIIRKKYDAPSSCFLVEYCRQLPGEDVVYLYSDDSIFQAYVKMKFHGENGEKKQ